MSLYERFTSEAAFRRDFVRPLLNRLGFYMVTEYHGQREFGKDFVFSELHRFGGMRYYAAQVKHERTIRLGAAIGDLIAQVEQAFNGPFTLPDVPRETYVSGVYIFNSGQITTEAKDDLLSRLGRSRYGANVFFLDGARLTDLDRWSGYRTDQDARALLSGLRAELSVNVHIWETIRKHFSEDDAPIEARSASTYATDMFLARPFMTEVIDYDAVSRLRQWAGAIENLSTWIMRSALNTSALKRAHGEAAAKTCSGAIALAGAAILQIDLALANMRPLIDALDDKAVSEQA